MEYQKIIKLLGDTQNQPSNLRTKNWVKVNDESRGTYNVNSRHFSHLTKTRIFKNINSRKKADRNFRGTSLRNHFRHPKLYSDPPSWLIGSRCHMGTFWKTKDGRSHFWESQRFRFCYVEVHHRRRRKSTKTGASS